MASAGTECLACQLWTETTNAMDLVRQHRSWYADTLALDSCTLVPSSSNRLMFWLGDDSSVSWLIGTTSTTHLAYCGKSGRMCEVPITASSKGFNSPSLSSVHRPAPSVLDGMWLVTTVFPKSGPKDSTNAASRSWSYQQALSAHT